jgi:N-acetyl-gamma-glutamyl-phosphate reductase
MSSSTPSPRIRTAVIGASGFTGAELLRLADLHPHLDVAHLSAASNAGQLVSDLHPSLVASYGDRRFDEVDIESVDGYDLVFLGLPHEASLELVPQLVRRVRCVVDLSAAFRLKDASSYPQWYGFEHDQPALLESAVYGLPEFHRNELAGAGLIATPGCYVTAAILALRPLVASGMVQQQGIIVDGASGVTGAGRRAEIAYSFTTVDENLTAYGLVSHRHTPEMEQEIGAKLLFTPHLVPMNRGILATCYSTPVDASGMSDAAVLAQLRDAYANEPFARVIESIPGTKATMGSNLALITGRYDARTNTAITICAIDNLTKGASGGAIQAANVALGLDEQAGLARIGVAP